MNEISRSVAPAIYAILRIPKSGSTSLSHAILRAIKPDHEFHVHALTADAQLSRVEYLRALRKLVRRRFKSYGVFTDKAMWQKIDATLTNGDVITGHFHYGALPLNRLQIRYVTIIRDPTQQFLSDYKWIRHGYQKRNAFQQLYHRGRTFAASSVDSYLRFLLDHAELFRNPTTGFITGNPNHPDPLDHLKKAFFSFGLLEEVADFCYDFEKKTGIPVDFPHLNASPSHSVEKLSGRNLSLFEQLYATDLELYARLKDHLQARKS